MKTKLCSNCKLDKSIDEYYKDKSKKDGLTTFCIYCKKLSNKKSYTKYKEVRKEYADFYRKENKDKVKKSIKESYIKNKEKYLYKNKLYRQKNSEKIKQNQKKYYNTNREKILLKYQKNREINLLRMRNWKKENRPKLATYQRDYQHNRKKIDPLFKLQINIRNLIRCSIKNKGLKKRSKTSEVLGCSFQDFKKHLESQFKNWMTWDNYGLYNGTSNFGWDIDHIIPNSKGVTEEEVIKLNHYTNFQPLCSHFNRDIKKDKNFI